jgi:dolichol-phosphate mannosyltransferase
VPAETLILVPTYDEIDGLESMVGRIRSAVPAAHVLVIDDASPDGTGELADRIAAADPAVRVLHRAGKEGLGPAYLAGFEVALQQGYRFVVEIDADGSHDPVELPVMLRLAADGADLVLGSRWVPGGSVRNWPRHRQAISRFGNVYARRVLRSRIRDLTSGYRVFSTDALRRVGLQGVASHGYGFQVELAWRFERAGLAVVEHPITFVERSTGRSKMHAGIVAEALLRVTAWGMAATLRGRREP